MIKDNDVYFKDGKYYLTENYVVNKMGTDLDIILQDELDTNLSTLAKRNIEYSADILYDYIEDNAFDSNSTFYDFTFRKEAFEALKKALKYQLFDYLMKGDKSLGDLEGVEDTVNKRSIQVLKAKHCFHILYDKVPDIKEW